MILQVKATFLYKIVFFFSLVHRHKQNDILARHGYIFSQNYCFFRVQKIWYNMILQVMAKFLYKIVFLECENNIV